MRTVVLFKRNQLRSNRDNEHHSLRVNFPSLGSTDMRYCDCLRLSVGSHVLHRATFIRSHIVN